MADKKQTAKPRKNKGLQAITPGGHKKTGRPSTYRPATAEVICARLADGETVTDICKTPGMPHRQTVHQWRMRHPEFAERYARAREIGMETMADDILAISDDDSNDYVDGQANHANVQRARLMVDTRKFLMAKLAHRVYGDRQQLEVSGNVAHHVTLSDRERMRRLALFLAEDSAAGVLIDGRATEADGGDDGPASPKPATADPPRLPTDDRERIDESRARDDDV